MGKRTSQQQVTAAVREVCRAVTVPGDHPDYHREQWDRLTREWPTLSRALSRLVLANRELHR